MDTQGTGRGKSGGLVGWAFGLALLVLLALLLAGGWQSGFFHGNGAVALYYLLVGSLFNVILFALLLLIWQRLTRRRGLGGQYNRELRYLRGWSGEEGRLRKEGLIRELNALGYAPRDLAHSLLAGADLKGVDLRGCDLRGADLREADLQGAVLRGATLRDADLTGANLSMADLQGANLSGAVLERAEMAKAEMDGATLNRANLVDANLYGTDLRRADLLRAKFAIARKDTIPESIHASVEDWIREQLDEKGVYQPE